MMMMSAMRILLVVNMIIARRLSCANGRTIQAAAQAGRALRLARVEMLRDPGPAILVAGLQLR
jgi:hypothetical protein